MSTALTTDARVARHARQLWEGAGRPAGGPEAFSDEARELAAIEENGRSALKPVQATGPYGEPVEENVPLENLGEFPTLTDQGDKQTFPDRIAGDVAQSNRIEAAATRNGDGYGDDDDDDDDEDDLDDAASDEEDEEEDEEDEEDIKELTGYEAERLDPDDEDDEDE